MRPQNAQWVASAVALAACLAMAPVAAQSYPEKPIRLIVPAAAGSPVEILSRVVADKISTILGQPIVLEVRPGASGTVGAQEVLKQPADGYTLLTVMMPMSVAQSIYANVPFTLHKDFAPVSQTAFSYNVLVVHPSVKANSAKELARLLQTQSGKLSFGSGTPGTPAHIAGELFKQHASADALHVSYNQLPQAIADLIGGQNQFMFVATPPVMGHIKSGKLRALAVTGPNRIAALGDLPTMREAGYPDFVVRDWQGFVVRAGAPREVISKLNAAIATALGTDDVKASFAKFGADPAAGPAESFGKLIETDVERWAKLARAANIKVQ